MTAQYPVAIMAEITLSKIFDRYYWKEMKNDMSKHVKMFCHNPKVSKEAPSLHHSILVLINVWNLVGIDIISHLHKTLNGNKYIVVVTDHFSKWTEATAVQDKSAKSVANFFTPLFAVLALWKL